MVKRMFFSVMFLTYIENTTMIITSPVIILIHTLSRFFWEGGKAKLYLSLFFFSQMGD